MRIGLVQIGSIAGDLETNVDRCVAGAEEAAAIGAGLIVLPAMAVPGSMPMDILFDRSFVEAIGEANDDLVRRVRGLPPVIAGTVVPCGRKAPGHPGLSRAAIVMEEER